MFRSFRATFWTLIALATVPNAFSQDVVTPAAEVATPTDDATQTLAEKRYALFAKQAALISLKSEPNNQGLTLRHQPLQTFSSDGNTFGSVFLWKSTDGRPGAIGTIGSLPIGNNEFGFTELHWLLPEPMQLVTIGKDYPKGWTVPKDAIKTELIANSPIPAATSQSRLVQMRTLARQFESHMTDAGTRHQLRLLPQPLYRYDDPSPENDGGIFAYVWTIGTDPELLLHIQARRDGNKVQWYYQPIRFTWRALELSHDNKEIWQAEEFFARDQNRQTEAYITTLTEVVE